MIKAVIFDCFGVLTVDSWREFRAPLNGQNKLKAQELTRAYDMGHIDENQLASEVADMLNVPAEVALAANKPKNQKNIALLAYIQQLRARGLKIGMLSNINSNWVREAFLSSEEQALFDDFVLSYDIKLAKPDPAIFRLVASRLSLKPEECVLVDDVDFYCQAAQAEGMKAIIYSDFTSLKNELQTLLETR